MKFIPILFSTPMVQAILEDRKTVTRRLIKSKHESGLFQVARRMTDNAIVGITSLDWDECTAGNSNDIQPKCKAADILWVRETWQQKAELAEYIDYKEWTAKQGYVYRADGALLVKGSQQFSKWKPSIFMPKEACRLFLEVVSVRPEKLQDITEEDAKNEGISREWDGSYYWYQNYLKAGSRMFKSNPIESFATLWQSINGEQSWNDNPWVWRIEYKKINRPDNFLNEMINPTNAIKIK